MVELKEMAVGVTKGTVIRDVEKTGVMSLVKERLVGDLVKVEHLTGKVWDWAKGCHGP